MTNDKCKALINKNPFNIIFINDEMCKLSVQQDGYALQFVKDKSIRNKLKYL